MASGWLKVGCWFVGGDDWSFARLIAPVVTTTSIILSSDKVKNGDIQVPANPGPPGKMAIKMKREGKCHLHLQGSHRSLKILELFTVKSRL